MASYPIKMESLQCFRATMARLKARWTLYCSETPESADDEGHRTQRVLSHGLGKCEDEGHEHECGYECVEGGHWGGRTALKKRVRTGKTEYWDVVTHLSLTKSVPL